MTTEILNEYDEDVESIISGFSVFTFDSKEEAQNSKKIISSEVSRDKIKYKLEDETTTMSTTNEHIFEFLEQEHRKPVNIVYTRVSALQTSVITPCSIELQLETCLDALKSPERSVVQVNEGVRSAYRNKQIYLNILRSFLIPGDTIYIYEVNRLSRNLENGIEFMNYCLNLGVEIISVNDKTILTKLPIDIKRFQTALIEANYESNRLSFRTKKTMAKLKKAGHSLGKIPFGKKRVIDKDGIRKNVDNPDEQAALNIINKYKEKGFTSELIIKKLDKSGHKYRGKEWTKTTVNYLINREKPKVPKASNPEHADDEGDEDENQEDIDIEDLGVVKEVSDLSKIIFGNFRERGLEP